MCEMLAGKLDEAGIEYSKITGQDVLKIKNITHVPMLETEDGKLMGLGEAMRYIKGVTA